MSQLRDLLDYAIILSKKDNVVTAMVDLPAGDYVFKSSESQMTIAVPEDVKAGFKLALYDIGKGEPVYKYGYVIGLASIDIKRGHCVHVHNLISSV